VLILFVWKTAYEQRPGVLEECHDSGITMQGCVQLGPAPQRKKLHSEALLLYNLQFDIQAARILQEPHENQEGDEFRRSVMGADQLEPVGGTVCMFGHFVIRIAGRLLHLLKILLPFFSSRG
jgi:hypothetical protein